MNKINSLCLSLSLSPSLHTSVAVEWKTVTVNHNYYVGECKSLLCSYV